ncbi:protocatechuate 3,4-dioxygenase [Aurantiacibacter gilvus]|uniref:Protocatechuate 3,4-dioxygenase n=1 Tax=Aurantiacibacter gilvus TaxID=3139141 RepID=A0ABU9IFQ9_9SPHN
MSHNPKLTRRAFTAGALASAAVGQGALAQVSQTPMSVIGPFYPSGYRGETDADLTRIAGHAERAQGQIIEVMGRVRDRFGNPINGARLDIWQANTHGRYDHPQDSSDYPLDPNFQGFASIHTGTDGGWSMTTVKPGGYGQGSDRRTPHIHVDVVGVDSRKILQMYFPEEAEANAADQLYSYLSNAAPRSTATALGDNRYSWDIVLIEG